MSVIAKNFNNLTDLSSNGVYPADIISSRLVALIKFSSYDQTPYPFESYSEIFWRFFGVIVDEKVWLKVTLLWSVVNTVESIEYPEGSTESELLHPPK